MNAGQLGVYADLPVDFRNALKTCYLPGEDSTERLLEVADDLQGEALRK